MDDPDELYEQARTALNEHRTDEAAVLLGRALAACPADRLELRLRVRVSQAWVVFERDGPGPAQRALRAVVGDAQAAGLAAVEATAQSQIGILLARSGELAAAARALARVDPEALPVADRMRLLMNRGTIASQVAHYPEAIADLSTAAELAAAEGVGPLEFMARHNLGWVLFLRGDIPAALAAMQQADDMPVDLNRSVLRLDQARVLMESGLLTDARDRLEAARTDAEGDRQAAEIDVTLARCHLLLGHPDEAHLAASRAAAAFAARAEEFWERRARLLQVATRPTLDDALDLRDDARRAADLQTTRQSSEVAVRSAVGDEIARITPDTELGRDLARDLAALVRAPALSQQTSARLAQARQSVAGGDPDRARRVLRTASRRLVRAQLGLASLDLRTAMAVHGEEAAQLDLELASGRGAVALLETSERWRAATRGAPPQLRPADDSVLADLASRLRVLRAELQPGDAVTLRQIGDLERTLREHSWARVAELPDRVTTLGHAALRAAAHRAGATVVVAVRRGERLAAVVLSQAPTRLVDLGSVTEVVDLVEATRADLAAHARLGDAHPLSGAVRASLSAHLDQLTHRVVEPLGELVGQLVVVPSRALSGLPWGSLPPWVGRPVTVAPTASSWALTSQRVADPRVACVVGPDLPAAPREAAAVDRRWSGAPVIGLVNALTEADVVHVAAHGEHRGDNPLFSNLLTDQGPVWAHELEGASVRASHVVLSACEIGRATHRPGDQPLGFTHTLLTCGVACVVAPVAPIADDLAATVMDGYHARLAAGAEAAVALAEATAADPAAGAYTCFGSGWRAG
ncbi:CHAT domain-containing protein [Aestuariimicrobium soli]|uniref:CHAT domain-containing protein n=1 Tax=Aestuariimicrobium soli TaxID=2035834 RepID=UPI003EBDD597